MFRLALNAGHYINEPGKRCLYSLDKNETREWVLNDRVCDKVEQKLSQYDGIEIIRIDDTTGKRNVSLSSRATAANNFGADLYISVHHNAGINGSDGGGAMAYVYTKVDDYTKQAQKLLYNKIIEKTALRGNRAQPLSSANFAELRLTKMPAVLLELGFMDSTVDVPIILTEDFAEKAAAAITEAVAELGKLTPKKTQIREVIYRVQVGAYTEKANAEKMLENLRKCGFQGFIKAE